MPEAALFDSERLRAANINPVTGLAGDYLNLYKDVAKAIASLGDRPEISDQVLDWRPVGYATHLRMTRLADCELAAATFEAVPTALKARFFAARREVELAIIDVQDLIEAAPQAASRLAARAPEIFDAIARLGGVINGRGDGAGRAVRTSNGSSPDAALRLSLCNPQRSICVVEVPKVEDHHHPRGQAHGRALCRPRRGQARGRDDVFQGGREDHDHRSHRRS